MAGEEFRDILNTNGAMEDIRKVIMASVNDPLAIISAGYWEGRERREKVRSYLGQSRNTPVEYTLYHTLQRAPDGKKFAVFLVKVERLVTK